MRADTLKHPCAQTCSGYTQAREEALSPSPESVKVQRADDIVTMAKQVSRQVGALVLADNLDFMGCSHSYVTEKISTAIHDLEWLRDAVTSIKRKQVNGK